MRTIIPPIIDPNLTYEIFSNTISEIFNKCCPNISKPLAAKTEANFNRCPWMTKALFKCCRKKSRLLKLYNKLKSTVNLVKYTRYRNILKCLIRSAEVNYYAEQFNSRSNDLRSTWNLINSIINNSACSLTGQCFDINGVLSNDSSLIAENFNNYFVNIGPNLAAQIPSTKSNVHDYLSTPLKDSMYLQPTDSEEVISVILSLKSHTSPGLDDIPTHVVISVAEQISYPLMIIINDTLTQGIFPDQLKHAKVIPVFKDSDKTLFSNYRPISILSVFSKVYERIIVSRLNNFLNKYDILYENQFGFKSNHSSYMAINSLVDKVSFGFESNKP